MSTLQVANIHLESTGNNRIQYDGSNTFTIAAGDANVAVINSSSISINTNTTIGGANVVTVSDTQTLTNKTLNAPVINGPVTGNVVLSQATWETGTNTTEALVSPAKVKAAISALGGSVDYQVFTSSGTWTKPSNATMIYVEMWGGGASGGCGPAISVATATSGGGGGAFYSFLRKASDFNSTVTVVVGAGGAAVRSGGANQTALGNDGGDSSFDTYTARGGKAGKSDTILPYIGNGGSGETRIKLGHYTTPDIHSNFGIFSGTGGGYPGDTASLKNGGNSIFGGAGGGFGASPVGTGGTSLYGGNGGAGGYTSTVAGSGSAPGGGGGSWNTPNTTPPSPVASGAGGRGEVRVWAW